MTRRRRIKSFMTTSGPTPGPSGEAAAAPPTKGGGFGKFLLILFVLLAALAIGVAVAWYIFVNIVVHVSIRDQPVGAELPRHMTGYAAITNELDVQMQGDITASVPFNQELTVPFRGRYDFDVEFSAKVPVKFDVAFDGVIPVDSMAKVRIRSGLNYKNLKALRNLDIETELPLQFPLPVKLNVPIDQTIDLTYKGPLSADINQDLTTRVDTVLKTTLPVDQVISTPVSARIPLNIYLDEGQVRLILHELDIPLRPSTMLGFKMAEEDELDGPERVDNPFGPLDPGDDFPLALDEDTQYFDPKAEPSSEAASSQDGAS